METHLICELELGSSTSWMGPITPVRGILRKCLLLKRSTFAVKNAKKKTTTTTTTYNWLTLVMWTPL